MSLCLQLTEGVSLCPQWVSLPCTPVPHLLITISPLCRLCFLLCSQWQRVINTTSDRGLCLWNVNICRFLAFAVTTDAVVSLERTDSLISLLPPKLRLVPLLVFLVHMVDTFTLSCQVVWASVVVLLLHFLFSCLPVCFQHLLSDVSYTERVWAEK